MQLKIAQLKQINTTGSDSDPVVFYHKHRKSGDSLVSLLHSIHTRSIQSLAPYFSEKVIEDWSDVPIEFYHHAITEYHSFYTFYNCDEKMVGFAGLPVKGFLKLFYFLPEFQRKGYGSLCLKFIEQDKNTNAFQCIGLKAHDSAAIFYTKQGYSTIRNDELNINGSLIPVKVMEKQL